MQFPPPAARSVDVIFRWRQRACKISKRKTVTTNTQPRFYMKLPIECGDRQCMMYKREQTIKQNPEKEKGSVCGMLAGRGKRPARPITACTILILRNSHECASEKTKRIPLAPNDRNKGLSTPIGTGERNCVLAAQHI